MKRSLFATIVLIATLFAVSFMGVPQASARPICSDGSEQTSDGTCPTNDAQTCFDDWNNKTLLKGSDKAKKYNQSGCDKSDGGTCTSKEKKKDGKTYLDITCKKPSATTSDSNYADEAATTSRCDLQSCDFVDNYINPLIKVLSVLVGIAVVIGIIWGGIQVASSGGDPQKVASGKNHIRNALIALVTYVLLFVLLNWLIPGGVI